MRTKFKVIICLNCIPGQPEVDHRENCGYGLDDAEVEGGDEVAPGSHAAAAAFGWALCVTYRDFESNRD